MHTTFTLSTASATVHEDNTTSQSAHHLFASSLWKPVDHFKDAMHHGVAIFLALSDCIGFKME